MNNQNPNQLSEPVKARNALIAIALTGNLILLEQVIHIPLWASIPTAALVAIYARYIYLKRNIDIQQKESGE